LKKKVIIILTIVSIIGAIQFSGVTDYLTFENLKANKEILFERVKENYVLSSVIFVLIAIIAVALSLPVGAVLTLAGGFVFGTWVATIYINLSATIGATLTFLITRYLIGNWIQKRYGQQLNRLNEEISSHGSNYLLTLRFIPIFPFFLINLCAGLTRIPLKSFIWTTAVGILPGDIVYSFAGSQLGSINSTKDIFSKNILIAFLLLAALGIAPVVYNKIRRKQEG
jgi:uncharacterized membrane protein YdjX (TVP38/TMEM64 family)